MLTFLSTTEWSNFPKAVFVAFVVDAAGLGPLWAGHGFGVPYIVERDGTNWG